MVRVCTRKVVSAVVSAGTLPGARLMLRENLKTEFALVRTSCEYLDMRIAIGATKNSTNATAM
jgi:hypothetical protein